MSKYRETGRTTEQRGVNGDLKVLPLTRPEQIDGIKPSDTVYLASENPEQYGSEHYQANKEVYWMSFIDHSILHPEVLAGYMTLFMQDNNSDIFRIFPLKITDKGRIYQNQIIVEPQLPNIGTRKVPHRNIHFKTSMTSASTVYTGQSFDADYLFMRTADGMAYFDRMFTAVVADIWCMIIYSAMKEFHSVPSYYVDPMQLYSYDEVPVTVDDLFEYERKWYGVLNKGPQAIHNLCAMISRIFERNNSDRVARILTTMDCANFINVKDQTNLYYDTIGPAAVANRSLGNVIRRLHNIETIGVQLLEGQLHSDNHDTVLKGETVTGGMAGFPERCHTMKACDYRSQYRDMKMSSWTSNKVETYSFRDFMHHCPEFIAINPVDLERVSDDEKGGLNRKLLKTLATEAVTTFAKTRTRLGGNEEHLHQFLHYRKTRRDGSDDEYDTWTPVFVYGEISECHLSTRALQFPYRTMEHAITSILSPEDKRVIEKVAFTAGDRPLGSFLEAYREGGDAVAREFVPAFEKFVTRLCEVNKAHPALNPHLVERGSDSAFDNTMVACWEFLVKGVILPGTGVDILSSDVGSEYMNHINETPLAQNDYFVARMKETESMSLFRRIAARLVLLQAINLKAIDSWHEFHVAIPLGGAVFRPYEAQFMESMIFIGDGEVGNTYFSGLDDTVMFDQGSQHFNVQVFGSFKTFIADRMKFVVAPFTRGLQILGGKGNKYITDDPNNGMIDYGSERWKEVMNTQFGRGESLGDYSIIPILQSYNHAIDTQFKERHLDIRGHWRREDFVTRLHNSPSFTDADTRDSVMYPNQFLTNYIYKFRSLDALRIEKASFSEIEARRRLNNHLHQTTQFVYNPLIRDWERVPSSHPWGEEEDNIVQLQNSSAPVGAIKV
jgi:hypothetical protein